MKRRASRSRHITGRLAVAMLLIAMAAAGSWYLVPLADQALQRSGGAMRTVVTSDDVNLRRGPGTSYEVVAVIPAGTELSSDWKSVDGFAAVDVNGLSGWIAADYLTEPGVAYAAEYTIAEADPVEPEPTSKPTTAPVTEQPVPTAVTTVAPVAMAPTVVPTVAPVMANSTQVEQEPQPGERWIEVNRTERTVTLHNGEIIVARFDALIGKDPSVDGYYSTATGTYYVHVKEKALAETPFADGVYLTDFVGFDPVRSNGFHSPTRDEFGNVVITGGTATLGCVRLSDTDAIFLFDFATIGMRVEVHD